VDDELKINRPMWQQLAGVIVFFVMVAVLGAGVDPDFRPGCEARGEPGSCASR